MNDISHSTQRLIQILEEQQALMHTLLEALRRERSIFVSARPSILERVQTELLPTANRIAELDTQRRSVADEIQASLQLSGELSVSLLASHLSSALADELMSAATATAALAKSLRVEQTVGSQLLNFSHQAQEGMYRDLMGMTDNRAQSYDRGAQTLTNSPEGGQLISGLI